MGHILSKEGIKTDPEKVRTILVVTVMVDVKALR